MIAGSIGPLSSIPILFFLPVVGTLMLTAHEFAVWAILNSVASIAVSVDFGGAVYAATYARSSERLGPTIWTSGLMSAVGAAVVTLVSLVIWIPYSHTDAASGWSLRAGLVALAIVGLASVLRGFVAVVANAALAIADYRSRNLLMVGQSVLMVAVALLMLAIYRSAWALPVAMLVSSAVALAVCTPLCLNAFHAALRRGEIDPGVEVRRSGMAFASQRTVAAVLSSVLLQGDRWVIGAIGGAEFLAAYEIVARLASAPRVLAQSVTASLLSDAEPARAQGTLPELRRGAARLVTLVAVGSAAAVFFGFAGAATLGLVTVSAALIAVPASLSFAVQGRSAVTSSIGIGLGRPGVDIPVLSVMLVGVAGMWATAAAMHNVWVAVIGSAVVIVIATLIYINRVEKPFRKGLRS